jgi:glycosyltransferase involved in cell wall biosynthesis
MPALPSVSVCIPVYRGEQFLAETIRSVLDQTYRDFELVVLDNASPDDSGRIARSFGDPRIRVETNLTTLPQPENWREAMRLCRAPLIKLVCADDLLHPRCLEYQVGPMEADPGLAVVAARRHMIDERSRVLVPRRGLIGLTGVRSSVEVARHVVRSGANPIGEPGGVLFRRAHYFAVGGWRPDHRFVMDLDLWIRLLQHGEFLGLPETLAAFRIGQDSLSADNETTIYAEQKAYIEELGTTPHLQVRASDMLMGRMRAPLGRARRRALFRMSRSAARRDERLQHATAGT